MHAKRFVLLGMLLVVLAAGPAMAGDPDISGLWRGALYGSKVQAQVEQDKRDVRVVAVVHDLAGGTNIYHLFGSIDHGHVVVVHGSGHRFEGDAHGGTIVGVLTTRGGTKLEVRASRVPIQPRAQGSMGQDQATNNRRPG